VLLACQQALGTLEGRPLPPAASFRLLLLPLPPSSLLWRLTHCARCSLTLQTLSKRRVKERAAGSAPEA
jgi:hypothetical protein